MGRISLPGKEKHKKIILLILILISIVIIGYEFNKNKNKNSTIDKSIESDYLIQGQSEKQDKTEESMNSQRETELYNEAYVVFFSNDYSNAVVKADEIIEEFPDSYRGYNIRGIAKAYNGDFDGGIADIDKSLAINSEYGYARFNKALTYELYEQFDSALEWYNKALEIENYVWTYYGIASIYGRRGDVDNTVEYLKKAIEIDEAVKNEAKTEKDFDPVRNSQKFQSLIG